MSIWNKVLLGLIIVASIGFFYMSSRMLKTQKYWNELADKHSDRIDSLNTENEGLQNNIDQVRSELAILNIDRQRVWYNSEPQVNVNRQNHTATIKVSIDQPNPSGIADKSTIYVFESASAAQQGRYLGEFKVTAVADKQITLEPRYTLTQADEDKLASAKHPWNLYDSLPHDNHEIFATLSDQDKKAMLPADSVEEYLNDGKNERRLRDYAFLFKQSHLQIAKLEDQIESADRDLKMVEDSLTDAKKQVQFYQQQANIVKTISEQFAGQRDAVNAWLNNVKEKIAEMQTDLTNLIKNNKAMAGQIAKIQLDASRRIDERTRAMAQTANGDN